MANLTVVVADVAPVKSNYADESSGIAVEAIIKGQYVRLDATTGKYALGNATNATEVGKRGGIALSSASAGGALTVLHRGIIDLGSTTFSSLNYGAVVYLSDTDGTLADAAGTVSTVVGYVEPGLAESTFSKLLYVAL